MFLLGVIAAVLVLGFFTGKLSSRFVLVPRKNGGYIMKKVPAYRIKIEKPSLDEVE